MCDCGEWRKWREGLSTSNLPTPPQAHGELQCSARFVPLLFGSSSIDISTTAVFFPLRPLGV